MVFIKIYKNSAGNIELLLNDEKFIIDHEEDVSLEELLSVAKFLNRFKNLAVHIDFTNMEV
jgi:hypothetical protein